MKHLLAIAGVVLVVLTTSATQVLHAQDSPRLASVSADTAKAGDTLTTEGENLDKGHVAELYLTDGQNDTKLEVVEQSATAIKFKVPSAAKPGRFSLMVLTTGAAPKLMEQPVKVTIE